MQLLGCESPARPDCVAVSLDFAVSQVQRLAVQPQQIQAQAVHLTATQQHYLQRVLRLSAGDRLVVMDGQGHSWWAVLSEQPDQLTGLTAIAATDHPAAPLPAITLVAALPKGNAFDEVVRQVTELGVQQIVPVISDRTLLQPSPKKVDRWRRIATEAAEQSERLTIPDIADPVALTQFWSTPDDLISAPTQTSYICTARRSAPHLLRALSSSDPPGDAITLLVGPEGGWTEREVEQAIARGSQPVSLGHLVLRAVTAAVAAVAIAASSRELL